MNAKVKALVGLVVVAAVATGGAFFLKGPSAQHKVLFIDSYHEGYEWSDGITSGIQQVMADQNVELKIHRMDTKRNGSEEFMQEAAIKAKAVIETFKPDIVIATDDNAQKYLIAPHYRGGDLPVVFAGVNWDASSYGYPAANVTGMVEVSAVQEMIDIVRLFSGGQSVGSLGGDTTTMRKEVEQTRDVLGIEFEQVVYVKTFAEWKEAYLELQNQVDILYMYNNQGIEGWDNAEAVRFVEENAQVPSASVQSWMAPYVLVTHTKDPVEQGEYAARTALRILDGAQPSAIPLTKNQRGRTIVNSNMARQLQMEIPASVLSAAENVL